VTGFESLASDGLQFAYDKANPVIEGFDATFSAGEVVAITGPSGRGKSTLLYLLGLMLAPAGGAVRLNGEDVSHLSDRSRAHIRATQFGFVFQDAALDQTRSVLDNVLETALYRGKSRASQLKRATSLLEEFGVALRAQAKPGQISGGQAQRIALCRALLSEPNVLLADEPTGNLDGETTALVLAGLRSHARSGAAVIVVTHDPDLVEHCDREISI